MQCKLQSVVNFDSYVTMPPTAVKVGKLKIANLDLNKKFILLCKVITKHGHKTLHENLQAEITKI